jgi:hypothetical protein
VPNAPMPLENEVDGTDKSMLENAKPPLRITPPSVPRSLPDARKLFANVKEVLVDRTYLSETDSAIVAYWVISTWFQNVLLVNPCLVITGPAHEATILLRALSNLCPQSLLLAGIQKSDIKSVARSLTLLISEPKLDSRTAVLLGSLTNRGFSFMDGQSWRTCTAAVAIYVGENSTVRGIQNSIWIDAAAAPTAKPRATARSREQRADPLLINLKDYTDGNMERVLRAEFVPTGLSLESYDIASALGSCLVDADDLKAQLVALLRPKDQQHLDEKSASLEALIVSATLNCCPPEKDQVFVKEIAAELNRLLEAGGETQRLTPEKVGHGLKKIGLLTRRLSQAGNGLVLDQGIRQRLRDLCAVYLQEDFTE